MFHLVASTQSSLSAVQTTLHRIKNSVQARCMRRGTKTIDEKSMVVVTTQNQDTDSKHQPLQIATLNIIDRIVDQPTTTADKVKVTTNRELMQGST